MSGDYERSCSHGCPEGGPDGNRQHVWDLHQGVRGGIVDGAARLGPPREPGPGKPQQRERESVTLTRPRGERP